MKLIILATIMSFLLFDKIIFIKSKIETKKKQYEKIFIEIILILSLVFIFVEFNNKNLIVAATILIICFYLLSSNILKSIENFREIIFSKHARSARKNNKTYTFNNLYNNKIKLSNNNKNNRASYESDIYNNLNDNKRPIGIVLDDTDIENIEIENNITENPIIQEEEDIDIDTHLTTKMPNINYSFFSTIIMYLKNILF